MPREKKTMWVHFQKGKNNKNADIVCCKYCNKSYTFPNATRMQKHLEACDKYPVSRSVNEDLFVHNEIEEAITFDTTFQSSASSCSLSLCDYSAGQSSKRARTESQKISSYFDNISSVDKDEADKAFARVWWRSTFFNISK